MLHRLQFRLNQINQSIMAESGSGSGKCPCGFVLEADDHHPHCMLCLGAHDMSQCSVCKSLSTTAKASRKRSYNDAVVAGFIVREGKKYPFPPVPPGTPGISSKGEENVAVYFQDRTSDNLLAQDDQEAGLHHLDADLVPGRRTIGPAPLSAELVAELRKRFALDQHDSQYLAKDPDFVQQLSSPR